jgi:hypothetical protein
MVMTDYPSQAAHAAEMNSRLRQIASDCGAKVTVGINSDIMDFSDATPAQWQEYLRRAKDELGLDFDQ